MIVLLRSREDFRPKLQTHRHAESTSATRFVAARFERHNNITHSLLRPRDDAVCPPRSPVVVTFLAVCRRRVTSRNTRGRRARHHAERRPEAARRGRARALRGRRHPHRRRPALRDGRARRQGVIGCHRVSLVSLVSYVSEDDPLSAMDAHVAKARRGLMTRRSHVSRLTLHVRSVRRSVGRSVVRRSVGRSSVRFDRAPDETMRTPSVATYAAAGRAASPRQQWDGRTRGGVVLHRRRFYVLASPRPPAPPTTACLRARVRRLCQQGQAAAAAAGRGRRGGGGGDDDGFAENGPLRDEPGREPPRPFVVVARPAASAVRRARRAAPPRS